MNFDFGTGHEANNYLEHKTYIWRAIRGESSMVRLQSMDVSNLIKGERDVQTHAIQYYDSEEQLVLSSETLEKICPNKIKIKST
jgi:hypothetical protein